MPSLKSATSVLGGVAGGGGSVSVGGYAVHKFTMKTLWEELQSIGFEDSSKPSDSDWTTIKERVKTINGEYRDDFLSSANLVISDNGSGLKDLCSKKLTENYSSKVLNGNVLTLKKVGDYCFLNIKEKIGTTAVNVEGSDADSKLTTNFDTLKSYNPSNDDPKIPEDHRLNTVKKGAQDGADPKKTVGDLRDWCKGVYKQSFKGDNNDDYKLAKKFCVSTDE